jgi:alcohol dehydrogenase class IV
MTERIKLANIDAVFGVDRALEIADDWRDLAARRPLIVGTPATEKRYGTLLRHLAELSCTPFFRVEAHSPAEIIDEAIETYRLANCDSVVTIGGGSSISIGKALAVAERAVFIAVPTTYSGSEATAIFGRRIHGEKRTAVDDRCRPARIIYDPQLSRTLPVDFSIASATNCMAHAVDALYAQDAGPVAVMMAREVLVTLRDELPKLKDDPQQLQRRERLLVAAFLGGTLVSMHGIALHHQLCHVIGGMYGTPHGANNTAVLPQAIAYNTGAVLHADKLLSEVFDDPYPARGVFDFINELAGNTALVHLGVPAHAAREITTRQLAHAGYNPKPLEHWTLNACIQRALDGTRPAPEEY